MTPTKIGTTTSEQINYLVERIKEGFEELKEHITQLDERIRKMEQTEASCIPVLTSRIEHVEKKLSDHETRLSTHSGEFKTLDKTISDFMIRYTAEHAQLMNLYRIVTWTGAALGTAIISLIIAIILGRAEVVFR